MGSMVAVGGFSVDADLIRPLEKKIDDICSDFHFPKGEVFKWSPGHEHWMRNNLIKENREKFQKTIISALSYFKCELVFVVEDKSCATACGEDNHELDSIKLLIERVELYLSKRVSKNMLAISESINSLLV